MYSKIMYFTLLGFVFLYVYSLFPVFSTGDGGGLITASYLLGIAHPPGYPVYVELGKLFSFLPIANIGIRVGLISVLFSTLSLYLIYVIIYKVLKDQIYALFSVLFLGFSYSFFYNSVVEKFYTLNLFIILILLILCINVIDKNKMDSKDAFLSSFLLGIAASIHHTALFMVVPMLVIASFYHKQFFRALPFSVIFFTIGFGVNIYLYIRSLKGAFSAAHGAETFEKLWLLINRKFYGSSSSLEATLNAIHSLNGLYNAFKNLFLFLNQSFSYIWIILVLFGFLFLLKLNKKLFILFFITTFIYGPFMAKITMSKDMDLTTSYISANQYFIPFLATIVILMGFGLFFLIEKLKEFNMVFAYKVSRYTSIIIPFLYFPLTFSSANQHNNWVPYYHGKDTLTILPVSSVISTFGDNHTFELWYLKSIGRYRDDVCHITTHYYNSTYWRTENCKPKEIYKPLIPEFFEGKFLALSHKNKLLSTVALSQEHPLSQIFISHPYEYIFFYVDKQIPINTNFYNNLNQTFFEYLTPDVCLNHGVDDLFTKEMCNFLSNSFLVVASTIKPTFLYNQNKIVVDADISYGKFTAPLKFEIYINPLNNSYIELYKAIRAYNDIKEFFLYREENE